MEALTMYYHGIAIAIFTLIGYAIAKLIWGRVGK
jgi:hypothetical protein